jgi:hypothetical protein
MGQKTSNYGQIDNGFPRVAARSVRLKAAIACRG